MDTVDNVLPAACPKCRHFEGMPFKAETIANGAVSVTLRCRLCVYRVGIEMTDGEVAIAPKRDRRRTRGVSKQGENLTGE